MQKPLMKYLGAEPVRSIVYLSALVFLKLAFQIALFSQGFISVSADEFARGIRAAQWALDPQLKIVADVKETWLPFEKYLNGLLLRVWPDVIWAPRVTVFIASCLVLIALFVLVYYLFGNFRIAALASAFLVFQPWYIWLSGTPMLEMYYFACLLGGLVFLVVWLRETRPGYWFWAGGCFMLASGFHVQSWVFINLVNLLTLSQLSPYIRQKHWGRLRRLLGFYLVGNSLIIVFAIIEFLDTGHLFAFLTNHTTYSQWFYGGYHIPIVDKLLYYPQIIIRNSSGVCWILLIVALAFLRRDQAHKWKWFPVALAALALSVNSAMNIVSGPPSAAPDRYALFYIIMIAPYLAYGTYHLSALGRRWPSRIMAGIPVVLSAGLFLFSIWWGLVRIPNFPQGMPTEAVETGSSLHQMLSQNESNQQARYLVELRYWDFLAVQLTAGHYDAIVYDREYNLFNRNTVSMFAAGTTEVCANLKSRNIHYVVLRDPNLKANAQLTGCLYAKQEIGHWTIYEANPEP